MSFSKTSIDDLLVFDPDFFKDSRGYFFESYNYEKFISVGISCEFVQDNQSCSKYGTLRGLHFQRNETSQAKLVRVLKGKVLDVAVDLRQDSKTFGKYYSIELSEENQKQLFIPRRFAHGFVVLSETAVFFYKCDNIYSPKHESGIIYNDPDLNIDWSIKKEDIILSEKDELLPTFNEYKGTL